jgi:crotonobetainyl-CoA:carnitine CoA-transferase CaiB-like acyl-CoA transferase
LQGIRVLALGSGMPGAITTMLMADYGADVITVDAPSGGDPVLCLDTRTWDRGKRQADLDLTDEDGVARVLALADGADVVIVGLDAADAGRLGLASEHVTGRNPDVVYVALTGFGLDDDALVPAHEPLAAAALGAMLAVPAIHRDGPVFPGHPAIAYSTAFVTVIGILAALRARIVSGRGDVMDASLRDGVLGQFTMNWWSERNVGSMNSRTRDGEIDLGTIRMIVRRYRCADGRRIGVHTGAKGAFSRLMKLLGIDDRISPVTTPVESASPLTEADLEVLKELPDIFEMRKSTEWLEAIWANEIAALPVLAPGEVFDDPQVVHNGLIRKIDDPELGPITVVGPPVALSASPAMLTAPSRRVGADIEWVGDGLSPVHNGRPLAAPLEGVRIVELSMFFAAPYANRLLADLGAQAIKVEPVSGDPMRSLPDPFAGVAKGKRSLALDMKADAARPVIEELLRRADVIQHNFRPGAAERLGVDHETVRNLNPTVIYDYAPGYGSSGPKSMLQSFAPLHSGFAGLHTEAAGEGNNPAACFGNEDYYNGQLNAIGQLLALVHRERTGVGQYLECPQLSSAVFVTSHWYRRDDELRSTLPTLDHNQLGWAPHQRLYQCLEGWLCVFCETTDQRAAFHRAVLADNGAVEDAELDDRLTYEMSARSAADWREYLRNAGVPCVVARESSWLHEYLTDPTVLASHRATRSKHETAGTVSVIGPFVRLASAVPTAESRAPGLGEHSTTILGELGIDDDTIASLIAAGTVVAADRSGDRT